MLVSKFGKTGKNFFYHWRRFGLGPMTCKYDFEPFTLVPQSKYDGWPILFLDHQLRYRSFWRIPSLDILYCFKNQCIHVIYTLMKAVESTKHICISISWYFETKVRTLMIMLVRWKHKILESILRQWCLWKSIEGWKLISLLWGNANKYGYVHCEIDINISYVMSIVQC